MFSSLKTKTESIKLELTIIKDTFTKLLAMRIVANSFLGVCNSVSIALLEGVSFSLISSISLEDKEKSAFSEAENKADKIKKTTISNKEPTIDGIDS
jgi:hypothetical protein